MDVNNLTSQFENNGWFIHEVENINEVNKSKHQVADYLRSEYQIHNDSDDKLLNNLHKHIPGLDDVEANKMIIKMIDKLGKSLDMSNLVHNASSKMIRSLVGCDIACQRNNNIVFQYPGSNRNSELHTDAPNNSKHEIVYWLPLVDCYETKSFYIVNAKESYELLKKYKNSEYGNWYEFKDEAIKIATHLDIKYGEILGFWSGLLHGSLVNRTKESRLSFNMRFKNLYAPAGLKDPFVFYEIFQISALTKHAVEM